MYFTGSPTRLLIAKIAPPVAVSSSLLEMILRHFTDFDRLAVLNSSIYNRTGPLPCEWKADAEE